MGIRVSERYGVNPSVNHCFFCLKEKNEIVLPGRVTDRQTGQEVDASTIKVWDHNPCDECREWMRRGIICIAIRDNETNHKDPYRTGGWSVVVDAAFERWRDQGVFKKDLVDHVLKSRVAFLEDTVWRALGLSGEPQ